MPVERAALDLEVLDKRQPRLDRRRLQPFQNEARNQGVERRGLQRLTERPAIATLHLRADVASRMAVVVVLRQHAQTAAAADQQPGEERASRPGVPTRAALLAFSCA